MNDDQIIVTVDGNGAQVFAMNRVLVRYELPDFEGAVVVVDADSDEPIQGQINFVDLLEFEQYALNKRTRFSTGEPDFVGMKRIKEEIEERRKRFNFEEWAENKTVDKPQGESESYPLG